MRKQFIIVVGLLVMLAACYKDKGNYDYDPAEQPLVTNLDTVYSVFVGDSLIVSPSIKYSDPSKLSFDW